MTNKTLGLNHYDCIKYSSISDLLGQANINTENQLMVLSDSSWKYCTYTGRSIGEYIIFYQGVSIDHRIYVPGPVAQSSAESD